MDLIPTAGADTVATLIAQALIAVAHLLIYFIKKRKKLNLMAFELIEDPNEYPLFKMTANNAGGGFAAIIPCPFVQERAQLSVEVANWMRQYTAMTPRAVWAEIAVDSTTVGVDPAPDPGGEASDKTFRVRITPAGMTLADSFTINVPCARFLSEDIETVDTAGRALAALYEADAGISKAVYIPNKAGR